MDGMNSDWALTIPRTLGFLAIAGGILACAAVYHLFQQVIAAPTVSGEAAFTVRYDPSLAQALGGGTMQLGGQTITLPSGADHPISQAVVPIPAPT
jgi:hypothetical protein